MKKIGIFTLHRANNYGAVLQNYALQKSIEKIGYEVETIDYVIPRIDKEYKILTSSLTKHPIKLLKKRYWEIKNFRNTKENRKQFKKFRKTYLKISNKEYTKKNIMKSSYDLYIVGSDQVWNKNIISSEHISIFDLSFTNEKKAAYAASCGAINAMIPISPLKKFDYITVREEKLQSYLSENGILSQVVCDPTLLLNQFEWKKLFLNSKEERFVYLYYIDSGRNEAAKIANCIAEEMRISVHYPKKIDKEAIKNNYGVNTFYEGPLEFVESIAKAEFVVVSSFHGVVFSLIMEKEFITILHNNTGDRVYSLLHKLGLEERIVSGYEDYLSKKYEKINYKKIIQIINEWREYSLKELMKICEL